MIRVRQLWRSVWTAMQGLNQDLKRMWKTRNSEVFLCLHVSHQIKVPNQTQSSRVKLLLSFLFTSQDLVFLMSHLLSLPSRLFQPTSTNQALIYPHSPCNFLFNLELSCQQIVAIGVQSVVGADEQMWLEISSKLHIDWKDNHITEDEATSPFSRIMEHTISTSCFIMCCSSFIMG